jgi:hypothetical protein
MEVSVNEKLAAALVSNLESGRINLTDQRICEAMAAKLHGLREHAIIQQSPVCQMLLTVPVAKSVSGDEVREAVTKVQPQMRGYEKATMQVHSPMCNFREWVWNARRSLDNAFVEGEYYGRGFLKAVQWLQNAIEEARKVPGLKAETVDKFEDALLPYAWWREEDQKGCWNATPGSVQEPEMKGLSLYINKLLSWQHMAWGRHACDCPKLDGDYVWQWDTNVYPSSLEIFEPEREPDPVVVHCCPRCHDHRSICHVRTSDKARRAGMMNLRCRDCKITFQVQA